MIDQDNETEELKDGFSGMKRFGDIAVEQDLLSRDQVMKLLKKQQQYKELGIPMRIDEIAVDQGLLKPVDCNHILRELKKSRTALRPKKKPSVSKENLPDVDLMPPCSFGHFELEERLGGLMGMVFRAFDTKRNQRVALKMLVRSLSADRPLVDRFRREVKAASKLSHPNIVGFIDAGEIENQTYFSMEYVDGESLNRRLERDGPLSEGQALCFTRDIAAALEHAHQNDLVHRDVKPENILIDGAGRARLVDLGLAKMLSDDQKLTASGIAIGTPHYIAPEQARGAKVIDGRADIYGLGATLFHLVTGRPPFSGNASEVMRQHVYNDPPDPQTLAPSISIQTRNLILKLMSKDAKKRVQTCAELAEAINRILDSLG